MYFRDSSFYRQSLCGYSQGFPRKETSNDSGVASCARAITSHAEVYALCA